MPAVPLKMNPKTEEFQVIGSDSPFILEKIKMAEHNLAIGITLDYIAFSGSGENCVIKPFDEEGQKRNVFWVENNYATLSYEEHCFRNFLLKWVDEHRENG